jgi:hypothetical protein
VPRSITNRDIEYIIAGIEIIALVEARNDPGYGDRNCTA